MKKKKKIIVSFGTRPEIIKLAPIIKVLKKKKIDLILLYSGQHYSKNMSEIFLKKFKINHINYNLKLGKKYKSEKFINIFYEKFKKILKIEDPDFVIVQGDTNTCLVSALATKSFNETNNFRAKIVHVEAGLRSYDVLMPEETNRIIVDHISHILFPPTKIQEKILNKEGLRKNIHVVGSTIVDNLLNKKFFKLKENFFLLTIHRFENVSVKSRLTEILKIMGKISTIYNTKVYFPCHPNTQDKIRLYKIKINENIKILNPIDYDKFLLLLKNSKVIFSDSGGLQEEACILKKHLITFRDNTERPETIKINANYLGMMNEKKIVNRLNKIFSHKVSWKSHPYGKNVSNKIVKIILDYGNKISVIGLGYIGLPFALLLSKKGFFVDGIDIDRLKVKNLTRAKFKSEEEDINLIFNQVKNKKNLNFSTKLKNSDFYILCLPTPLKKKQSV